MPKSAAYKINRRKGWAGFPLILSALYKARNAASTMLLLPSSPFVSLSHLVSSKYKRNEE
ncbi:hypothetical protein [Metabacillus litoralis]|uniref:hypothetical protein n=1 Tax=Metabacillus litoralis TaxID=152268 RepID=UPI002041E669|nr:hypothetical protein [Metabacillus litoralis]